MFVLRPDNRRASSWEEGGVWIFFFQKILKWKNLTILSLDPVAALVLSERDIQASHNSVQEAVNDLESRGFAVENRRQTPFISRSGIWKMLCIYVYLFLTFQINFHPD